MASSSMTRSRFFDRYLGLTDGAEDAEMDADLWGKLQWHIDLVEIFVKLPVASFFRLRQVCKRWSRLASDRQFLERTFTAPVADPFFVVTTPLWGQRLLTCRASSWSSMPLPQVKCAVSGLLFQSRCEFSDPMRILDLHTRVWHRLPRIPTTMLQTELEDEFHDFLFGMTVDTTVVPYSFRVFFRVFLEEGIGTCIYDSKTGAWTQKPTNYDSGIKVDRRLSCVNNNQFLYIKAAPAFLGSTFDLHVYDQQRDEWNFETMGSFVLCEEEFCNIGLWRERLFAFGVKFTVSVTDQFLSQLWTDCDSMPGELCAWIAIGNDKNIENIQSIFCNEHVLLYNCIEGEEKAVLYHLDLKTWEKVALPAFPPPHPQTTPAKKHRKKPALVNNSL